MRARDLFYALWTPDLFMERVQDNADWSFFCPNECTGLQDAYGDEFKELYHSYEHKAWLAKPSLLEKFGTRLLKHKSRQVRRTCSTRMLRTSSPTRRTWERFDHPTSAQRSWSTPLLTKLLSATSHPSLYQSTSRTVRSITTFSSMLPIMQQATSTGYRCQLLPS